METTEILYIILGASIVVLTVTIVWVANEAIGLIRSLRKSSENTEVMTKEMKEKVLVVSEALDRAATAATNIIGLIEDSVEVVKEKRDEVASTISLVTGAAKHFSKDKKEPEVAEKTEEINIKPSEDKKVDAVSSKDKAESKELSPSSKSDTEKKK